MNSAAPPRLRYQHASGLHGVERALRGLHRELMLASGQEHGQVHTSVLNLVAACTEAAQAERAAGDLLRIGARHPSRAIVIVASPEGAEQLEADVSLHASEDGREGSELVRLEVGGEPAYHLTSIVTPLLIPDMPVYLWVVGAPPLRQAFSEEAVALTDRIILDSGEFEDAGGTLRLISDQQAHFGRDLQLADIAWERIVLWREMLAQAFDGAAARPWLRNINALEVRCTGGRVSSDAWLLAGWLASRLGWRGDSAPRIDVDAGADSRTEPSELTAVRVRAERGDAHASVALERRDTVMHVAIDIEGAMTAARSVSIPARDEADLISDLMTEGVDPAYPASVAAGAELAGQTR